MGRKLRVWLPNYFYHIVCRGNRRDALFRDDGDFITFLYILKKVHDTSPFEITSFCLMTNHYHLQLRSSIVHISKVMSLLNRRYACYYNTKYNLTGHVFEKRYFDELITDRRGMLEVSSYIHLNPVDAGMVNIPSQYRWSSYTYYEGKVEGKPIFLADDILLNCFSGTKQEQQDQYCELINKAVTKIGW